MTAETLVLINRRILNGVAPIFDKKTEQTPKAVIQVCQDPIRRYDEVR